MPGLGYLYQTPVLEGRISPRQLRLTAVGMGYLGEVAGQAKAIDGKRLPLL